jgi:hypothetical protein
VFGGKESDNRWLAASEGPCPPRKFELMASSPDKGLLFVKVRLLLGVLVVKNWVLMFGVGAAWACGDVARLSGHSSPFGICGRGDGSGEGLEGVGAAVPTPSRPRENVFSKLLSNLA